MSPLVLPPDVARVMRAAFGGATAEEVSMMHGGRSGARLFAVRVDGNRYVVRTPDPGRDQHHMRAEREIACMTLAGERGIGPELRHADHATGITISVLIEGMIRGPAPGRAERLAATLRKLHEGPRLPGGGSVAAILDHFDGVLRARGAGGVPVALGSALREAAEASSRFAICAPCHRDLNPGNVLETAERAYLVDWETAGEGDPFVDLAQLGVFSFPAPERRAELLAAYLGRAPTARERAHAALARVTALGFFAVSFIANAVVNGAKAPDDTSKARPMSELFIELAEGRASATDVAAGFQHATLQEAASDAYRDAMREAAATSP
jgi:aminoglycoside phosphotransferase (APT) family kinase protein